VRVVAQELLEEPVIGRKLDDRATRRVSADDIPPLKQVVEQRAGVGTGIEGKNGNGHRLSLLRSGSTLASYG
jgi:hypothetical protein